MTATDTSLPAPQIPRPGTPARLRHLYREHVEKEGREERLLIALSYVVTFLLVRFITHSIKDHRFTWLFHNVASSNNGVHIHHFIFGIIVLMLAGYVAIALRPQRKLWVRLLAVAFGAGAALTIDEFALWLNLKDVYWAREGRESIDAAFVFGSLITIGIAGRGLFIAMAHDIAEIWRGLH